MDGKTTGGSTYSIGRYTVKPMYVFLSLWCVLFLLYLPAVRGGWVSDPVEMLGQIRRMSFWEYVTLKESRGNMYQLTQLSWYLSYKLFGIHAWPWHLVFITLQAVNAMLLFAVCVKLFDASAIKDGVIIAAGATILFCICPHISEVLVWRASYHYLQAMLLMLANIYFVQKFQSTPSAKYAVYAGLLFLLSTFYDEFYFITPFLVTTLIVYYRIALGGDKITFKRSLLYFILPVAILVGSHIIMTLFSSGSYATNLGDEARQPLSGYLRKPLLYLFHTIFFGRFFSHDVRQMIYDFAVTNKGLVLVYGALAGIWIYIILRFRKMTPTGKVVVLIFSWLHVCIAIVCPVWFPQTLLVNFDRYTYFMLPWFYLLVMFLLVNVKMKEWGITFFIVYAFINAYFTIQGNNYWKQSARVVDHLVHNVPPIDNNKILLLLNVPGNMNGVPMIGPFLHFSFRKMYNLYNERQINNTTFDVVSYNMSGPNDGAHVNVYGDSLMHVTLNQWGTWWWYGMWGAFSYENEYFKVNMIDMGHWYELTLKRPASDYVLLYNVGDEWKVVDWNRKNDDQN